MGEIPEDIDRIATDIVRMPLGDDPEWETYKAIARAILAERKRCAEIATAHLSDTSQLLSNPPKSGAAWAIRNAINSGEQP